nr:hypothetical protein Itr_chr08CG14460 [Ipomoea trifida]
MAAFLGFPASQRLNQARQWRLCDEVPVASHTILPRRVTGNQRRRRKQLPLFGGDDSRHHAQGRPAGIPRLVLCMVDGNKLGTGSEGSSDDRELFWCAVPRRRRQRR